MVQYYFLLIICISFFSSVSIYRWNYAKEQENRKLFADKLLSQNDITTDYYLKSIEHKLLDDNFIKYYFINPISLKSQFEKRLRIIYFTGHLSRYDISVFDFDTLGNHYKVRNPFSYKQLDYAYKNQTISTIGQAHVRSAELHITRIRKNTSLFTTRMLLFSENQSSN